jgi:hypothetical protein
MVMIMWRGTRDPNAIWFGICFAIVVFTIAFLYERNRRQKLAAAAATMGFVPGGVGQLSRDLPLVKRCTGIENVYTGNILGYEGAFFDLRIGRGRGSYKQTVAWFRRPGVNIPQFQLHETNLGDRLSSPFSSQTVNIQSDPNFSARFTLRSSDREGCERFFTPEVAAYFTQLPDFNCLMEGVGDSVILYRRRKRVSSELINFMNEKGNVAAGFFGLLRPVSTF